MSKEMMKLGLLNEMVDDSIDSALQQPEEMEEMAQAEVDKILFDLTNGAMGNAPDAVTDTLQPVPTYQLLPPPPRSLMGRLRMTLKRCGPA